MDKQQAAENAYPSLCALHLQRDRAKQRLAFIDGWEAHEAQSPTDAVQFHDWAIKEGWRYNIEFWHNSPLSQRLTTAELYKLFNPSVAAKQPVNQKLLIALKELHHYTDGHKAFKNMIKGTHLNEQARMAIAEAENQTPAPPTCPATGFAILLEALARIGKIATAQHELNWQEVWEIAHDAINKYNSEERIPQAAGPVWVNPEIIAPKLDKLYYLRDSKTKWKKYVGRFMQTENLGVVIRLHSEYDVCPQMYQIEYLDETNTQVHYTPDQIENAFYAACNMINRHLGEKAISVETVKKLHKDYMELNWPEGPGQVFTREQVEAALFAGLGIGGMDIPQNARRHKCREYMNTNFPNSK